MTTMHELLRTGYSRLLHHLSPPYCVQCRAFLDERVGLCAQCRMQIRPVASMQLPITRSKSVKVLAISHYEEPLKSLILKKSYGDISAAVALGNLAWKLTDVKHLEFDYVVPVPLHWRRYAWRGYNQAEEMARVIAQRSGKPLLNAIKRTRYGPFQANVAGSKRDDNVRGAFELCPKAGALLKGKRVLLVDDLVTSGATLRAVSFLLLFLLFSRTGGAGGRLNVLVACRASS